MALLEPTELVQLAGLFRGLLGGDPTKRLKLLLPAIADALPPFGALDGSDGPFLDFLGACDENQLRAVLRLLAKNPDVASVIDRLDGSAIEQPWHILSRRRVVLGRPRFRDQLPDLLSGRSRVALFRGQRFTGKTYTVDILRDKTRGKTPKIEIVSVDVIGANSVRQIASAAVRQMGGDTTTLPTNDPKGVEDSASSQQWWVNQLAEWIAVASRRDEKRQCWLVFDGYERVREDPDTTQLMAALAVRAVEWSDDPNGLRVLFVDHPDLLPPKALGVHVREDINLVTELEVIEVLSKVFPSKKPEELRPIAREVMADANDPDTRLPLLQERLSKIVFTDP